MGSKTSGRKKELTSGRTKELLKPMLSHIHHYIMTCEHGKERKKNIIIKALKKYSWFDEIPKVKTLEETPEYVLAEYRMCDIIDYMHDKGACSYNTKIIMDLKNGYWQAMLQKNDVVYDLLGGYLNAKVE